MPVISSLGAMSAKGFGFVGGDGKFKFTFSANQQELNLYTYLTAQGCDCALEVVLEIANGTYLWSNNTSTAALIIGSQFNNLLTITNYGYIMGKGGNGGFASASGTAGGPAISNSATGVTFINASGAFIGGGGGGGGGGVYNTND